MAVFALLRILVVMDLASKPIIFIFTGKFNAFKSLKNNVDTLGWFCKHRLYWDAHSNMALVLEQLVLISTLHQFSNHFAIVWKLTDCLLDGILKFVTQFKELFFS